VSRNGFNFNIPFSFKEFKLYFEFSLKVLGLLNNIITLVYKLDIINSIYKVTRGQANNTNEAIALKAFQESKGVVQ
jgi:hypothetical protein